MFLLITMTIQSPKLQYTTSDGFLEKVGDIRLICALITHLIIYVLGVLLVEGDVHKKQVGDLKFPK